MKVGTKREGCQAGSVTVRPHQIKLSTTICKKMGMEGKVEGISLDSGGSSRKVTLCDKHRKMLWNMGATKCREYGCHGEPTEEDIRLQFCKPCLEARKGHSKDVQDEVNWAKKYKNVSELRKHIRHRNLYADSYMVAILGDHYERSILVLRGRSMLLVPTNLPVRKGSFLVLTVESLHYTLSVPKAKEGFGSGVFWDDLTEDMKKVVSKAATEDLEEWKDEGGIVRQIRELRTSATYKVPPRPKIPSSWKTFNPTGDGDCFFSCLVKGGQQRTFKKHAISRQNFTPKRRLMTLRKWRTGHGPSLTQ